MKKILLSFAFVLVAQIGLAQDEAFKKDVMKLMEVSGGTSSMSVAKDQVIKMIPQEKQAAFLVEFNASLPALYDKMAKIYMEVYTKEDVKDLLKFYESPIGKKMSSKVPEITQKSMAIGQEWGAETLQGIVMKYMMQ